MISKVLLLMAAASISITSLAQQNDSELELKRLDETDFIKLWDDITPKLDEILELEKRHPDLPDNAFFGPDKDSNRESINELLDSAIATLAVPSGQDYRARIRQLEDAINGTREKIATLRQQRISAPKEALWQKTAADYDSEITAGETHIQYLEQKIVETRQAFATELRDLGLEISDEQLQFLLSTVVGDDVIAMSVAFDNVKVVTLQLEQLLVESGEDLVAARRYYGMYTILLTALEHMHLDLLHAVDGYQKKIDGIVEKTANLMAQSKRLSGQGQRHQRTLQANIEAQKLTLKTAKMYRNYLLKQARDVISSRQRIAHDLAVARNTFETVKISGELVQLVRSGQQLLETLFNKDMPTMFSFQNLEMRREFEKLTSQLKELEER